MSNQAKVILFIYQQTIEAKKDEFRAYLEKTGVVDQLTKVLVSLYEESDKPNNPLEFIKKNMSAPEELDSDNLKNEYLKLKKENEKLRLRVTDLQKQVCLSYIITIFSWKALKEMKPIRQNHNQLIFILIKQFILFIYCICILNIYILLIVVNK